MTAACGKASLAARVRLALVGLCLQRAHWQWQRAGALFLAPAAFHVRIRIGTVRKQSSAHAAAVRVNLVVNAFMLLQAVYMWGWTQKQPSHSAGCFSYVTGSGRRPTSEV